MMKLSTQLFNKQLTIKAMTPNQPINLTIQLLSVPTDTQQKAIKLLKKISSPTLVGVKKLKPQLLGTKIQPIFTNLYAQFGCFTDEIINEPQNSLKTEIGGVYWLINSAEFIISFCELEMQNLVECGNLIQGLECLEAIAEVDGKGQICEIIQIE